MSHDKNRSIDVDIAAQIAATWAALDKSIRADNLQTSLQNLNAAFSSAMNEMKVVRNFVGSPEKILGNLNTKHGEIAEQVHVGVTRAWDVFYGRSPSATFEGIGRNSPVDYQVNGVDIQSKYINGLRNTFDHILKHANKYPEFAEVNGEYHIPRDYYEKLKELIDTGKISNSDLSDKSLQTLYRKIDEVCRTTGRNFEDVIKPANATYQEVQQANAHKTLDSREQDLKSAKKEVQETSEKQNAASFGGFGQAAAYGAVAGGGVRLTQALWTKFQAGKNPFRGDFTVDDWKDVGIEAATGAGQGGIAGGALYLLTNATDLAAPFAGSMVSGLIGIGDLLRQYSQNEINSDQFIELSLFVATDAAIVGLTTAIGQSIIPIPILGALLGSVAGKLVASALKEGLKNSEQKLVKKLESYINEMTEKLDVQHKKIIAKLSQYFDNLEELIHSAFNEENNTSLRLAASVTLAESMGVDDALILRSIEDIDKFMME
ncbi:MAG: hypothetical protein HC799_19355 [Limnothrix sp. RL_2_0]|nr:hypothetical protein [Limnothrix sp. RL_2_0]